MPRKTMAHTIRSEISIPASMRPRPDAAENLVRGFARGPAARGFNEAAARCRGKLMLVQPVAAELGRLQ